MKPLNIAHRLDLKNKSQILERIRALKNQLEEAKETQSQFSKDDQALRMYLTVLHARIQELSWVLNDTELFTIKNNTDES